MKIEEITKVITIYFKDTNNVHFKFGPNYSLDRHDLSLKSLKFYLQTTLLKLSITKLQYKITFKTLNTVHVCDFMTDGSRKVNDTNGVQCREMNSVGYTYVSMVIPLGGTAPKAVFELSMLQIEAPCFYPVSMKADAYTSLTHLQAPRNPFKTMHSGNKPNLTSNLIYLVNELLTD